MRPGPGGIRAHRATGAFHDVGAPADYLRTALAIGRGNAIESGATIAPGARVTQSIVWPGATIGANAVIDGCIVTNVDVPSGFHAKQSVLVPASVCQARDHARVTGSIACFPLDPNA